jgi:hypothetical protein
MRSGAADHSRSGQARGRTAIRPCRLASLRTGRQTASGVLSMLRKKRISPWRPSSATAMEIFSLKVSRPTNTLFFRCTARPQCGRLGADPSGATLAHRTGDEPPLPATNIRPTARTLCSALLTRMALCRSSEALNVELCLEPRTASRVSAYSIVLAEPLRDKVLPPFPKAG